MSSPQQNSDNTTNSNPEVVVVTSCDTTATLQPAFQQDQAQQLLSRDVEERMGVVLAEEGVVSVESGAVSKAEGRSLQLPGKSIHVKLVLLKLLSSKEKSLLHHP